MTTVIIIVATFILAPLLIARFFAAGERPPSPREELACRFVVRPAGDCGWCVVDKLTRLVSAWRPDHYLADEDRTNLIERCLRAVRIEDQGASSEVSIKGSACPAPLRET